MNRRPIPVLLTLALAGLVVALLPTAGTADEPGPPTPTFSPSPKPLPKPTITPWPTFTPSPDPTPTSDPGPFGIPEDPYEQDPLGDNLVERPTYGDPTVEDGLRYRTTEAEDGDRHQYSNVPAWNADGTLLAMGGGYGTLIDGETLADVGHIDRDGVDTHTAWLNQPEHADKMFAVSNASSTDAKAYLLTVQREDEEGKGGETVRTPLRDFADDGYEEIRFGPGEGAVSTDDTRVTLVGRQTGSDDAALIVYDIADNEIVAERTLDDKWPQDDDVEEEDEDPAFDYAMISQSGDWVVLNARNYDGAGMFRYDADTLSDELEITDIGKHSDACVDNAGDDVLVTALKPWKVVRMSDGETADLLPDLEGGGHVSCRNTGRPGWAYYSSGDAEVSEILAITLDSPEIKGDDDEADKRSEAVERFGYHNSSTEPYRAEPHASVSADGSKVAFASDWQRDGDPEDIIRTYVVDRAP